MLFGEAIHQAIGRHGFFLLRAARPKTTTNEITAISRSRVAVEVSTSGQIIGKCMARTDSQGVADKFKMPAIAAVIASVPEAGGEAFAANAFRNSGPILSYLNTSQVLYGLLA